MSEKLLNTRLISYITKNKNILPESQLIPHGKSTETAIHDFLERVQKATEKKDRI